MDWLAILISILTSLIGSFFGFGFALVLSKRNDKLLLKKARRNLNDELRRVQNTFNAFLELDPAARASHKIFLDKPIWTSLVSTGGLLELLEVDQIYYRKVLTIHFKLHAIEQMENSPQYNEQRFLAMQEAADEIDGLLVREI